MTTNAKLGRQLTLASQLYRTAMLVPALGILAAGGYMWSRMALYHVRCDAGYPVSHRFILLPMLITVIYLATWRTRSVYLHVCRLVLPFAFWVVWDTTSDYLEGFWKIGSAGVCGQGITLGGNFFWNEMAFFDLPVDLTFLLFLIAFIVHVIPPHLANLLWGKE
jgi:hypothetical protein